MTWHFQGHICHIRWTTQVSKQVLWLVYFDCPLTGGQLGGAIPWTTKLQVTLPHQCGNRRSVASENWTFGLKFNSAIPVKVSQGIWFLISPSFTIQSILF